MYTQSVESYHEHLAQAVRDKVSIWNAVAYMTDIVNELYDSEFESYPSDAEPEDFERARLLLESMTHPEYQKRARELDLLYKNFTPQVLRTLVDELQQAPELVGASSKAPSPATPPAKRPRPAPATPTRGRAPVRSSGASLASQPVASSSTIFVHPLSAPSLPVARTASGASHPSSLGDSISGSMSERSNTLEKRKRKRNEDNQK